MSTQQSTFSSSSYSYSSSSSNTNGQTTGQRTTHFSQTGPDGTTVQRTSQNLGEPEVRETQHFDAQGRQLVDGSANDARRIQDVTDEEQADRDREYEERIEEEYAKREGGA